ncbi:MAG TPA: hypothetical protein VFT74_08620, partial [Isosphaeraceae bacterium]|nr:hypothetical protein [Isosphaeraceae bacterium]
GAGPIRSCRVCRKDVFDLIALTTEAAGRILADRDALPCVRLCRDPKGRVVTADSPTGPGMRLWRWLRRRSGRVAPLCASLFALIFLPGCGGLNRFFQYGAPGRYLTPTDSEQTVPDPHTGSGSRAKE